MNRIFVSRCDESDLHDFPLGQFAGHIPTGAAIGLKDGKAFAFAPGMKFAGFNERGGMGANTIAVRHRGMAVVIIKAGNALADSADFGAKVWATGPDSFALENKGDDAFVGKLSVNGTLKFNV